VEGGFACFNSLVLGFPLVLVLLATLWDEGLMPEASSRDELRFPGCFSGA
jgi:hypothetical protein